MHIFGPLTRNAILNFNQIDRDAWVKHQVALVKPGSQVLDVGAGGCPYRRWFSHCIYRSQDFARLDPGQLRERSGYGDIDYICDATAIPVPDRSFDVVLCTEVLEHVPDPVKVVMEIGRVLKAGGKLLLTAPLGSGLHQEPYHFYGGYTPHWYHRFLKEAGFKEIQIEGNGGFFKHYGQESIRFAKLLAPWNKAVPWLWRVVLLPPWILFLPWFAFILPLVCHLVDSLDKERGFTVGYHVSATKVG